MKNTFPVNNHLTSNQSPFCRFCSLLKSYFVFLFSLLFLVACSSCDEDGLSGFSTNSDDVSVSDASIVFNSIRSDITVSTDTVVFTLPVNTQIDTIKVSNDKIYSSKGTFAFNPPIMMGDKINFTFDISDISEDYQYQGDVTVTIEKDSITANNVSFPTQDIVFSFYFDNIPLGIKSITPDTAIQNLSFDFEIEFTKKVDATITLSNFDEMVLPKKMISQFSQSLTFTKELEDASIEIVFKDSVGNTDSTSYTFKFAPPPVLIYNVGDATAGEVDGSSDYCKNHTPTDITTKFNYDLMSATLFGSLATSDMFSEGTNDFNELDIRLAELSTSTSDTSMNVSADYVGFWKDNKPVIASTTDATEYFTLGDVLDISTDGSFQNEFDLSPLLTMNMGWWSFSSQTGDYRSIDIDNLAPFGNKVKIYSGLLSADDDEIKILCIITKKQ